MVFWKKFKAIELPTGSTFGMINPNDISAVELWVKNAINSSPLVSCELKTLLQVDIFIEMLYSDHNQEGLLNAFEIVGKDGSLIGGFLLCLSPMNESGEVLYVFSRKSETSSYTYGKELITGIRLLDNYIYGCNIRQMSMYVIEKRKSLIKALLSCDYQCIGELPHYLLCENGCELEKRAVSVYHLYKFYGDS